MRSIDDHNVETTKTNAIDQIQEWALERSFNEQSSDRNGYNACITEELGEWLKSWDDADEHEKVDALNDIIVFSITELLKLGYDANKSLVETHKEISSRTGEWNDEAQKWMKYKTPEAKALWVKSDFTDCKLD